MILAGVGILLGAQGVVGWIMVASGLKPGMTAVEPLKLTLHLVLATLFFASLIALFVRLGGAEREAPPRGARWAARLLVVLAFVQIALGGLVAGHHAGLVYDTWPLMDGSLVPSGLAMLEPLWRNAFDNIMAVQFNHRIGAYVLAAAIFAYAIGTRRGGWPVRNRAILMSVLVLAQLAVGIATLIHGVPTALALSHQAIAMILFFVLVWNVSVFRGERG